MREDTMKRRDLMRLGAATAVLAAVGMGSGGAALAQTKMVFKASDVHADGYPTVVAIQNFGKKLSDADRKSTRLNSSHTVISYAVFCLKKKNEDAHKAGFKMTFDAIHPASCRIADRAVV